MQISSGSKTVHMTKTKTLGSKMTEPLVSLVITTKNEENNIEPIMESIQAQRYKTIETILVDNNSSDKTKELARQ